MGPWWIYLLVFIFGYFTHKTFYFFRSLKISIGLIRVSQLISLAVLAKSIENLYYSHTTKMRQMRDNNESAARMNEARRLFNNEISEYKNKAIQEMIDLHPAFYDPIVDFDDWKSAMSFLEENKKYIFEFLNQDKNDKKTP
tara:strand:+ start:1429 stop:1851 length:423 start_codon:yes stop_codon:yes gene_type:complete